MNKKPTITEIRSYLAKHGATLKRAKMTLNSRPAYVVTYPVHICAYPCISKPPAYVVTYPNGRMSTYTDAGLIQAYIERNDLDFLLFGDWRTNVAKGAKKGPANGQPKEI